MARSSKPDVDSTIARLEEQIEASAAELDMLEGERRRALIAVAQDVDDATQNAERYAGEIREKRDLLQALRGALDDAMSAKSAIDADRLAAQAQREREKVKDLARTARKAANELNLALDAVGVANANVREACKQLWSDADGNVRRDELGEMPRLLSSLPAVINERLAYHHVLGSRVPLLDRDAPPPCVASFLDTALDLIAPGPGRPKKTDPSEPVQETAA